MTSLVRFLLVNAGGGFAIGLATGAAFLMLHVESGLFAGQPLAMAMTLWAFGSSFAAGAVATGLALLPYR